MKKLKNLLGSLAIAGLLGSTTAQGALVIVTNDIAAGTTNTWVSTNEYLLNTMVYVQSNAVLNIEPGTVVKGGTNAANLIARNGLQNLVAGLWVTRGGKLYATGTVSAPIIFTMEGDDVNNLSDVPPTTTGKWGGIVMMGRASINSAQFAAGQAASPKYDVYEGVATVPSPQTEHIFGGNDDSDSSGALRYVSIRHTGNTFAPGKELNGLTMGGVGSGTDISYVEVLASSDDGFEWWGGTVSTHHLIGAFNEDDDFDTDQGYRGTNQFWFAIKPPWAGSSDSRAMETDGDLNQTVLGDATPFSQWTVYNATLIGRGKGDILDLGGNQGWNARDEAAPNVINSVFAEFNNGLLLDGDGLYHWTNTTVRASTKNCVWDNVNAGNANGLSFITNAANNHFVGAALLTSISYTNTMALDPRPQAGSPALTDALPGAPVATTYRGAFGPNDNWASGWTALATEGFLSTNTVIVPPTAPTITSVAGSGTLSFSVSSQNGYSYILQATPVLSPPAWTNKETLPGNGGTLNFAPVVTTNAMEYFRILAQ